METSQYLPHYWFLHHRRLYWLPILRTVGLVKTVYVPEKTLWGHVSHCGGEAVTRGSPNTPYLWGQNVTDQNIVWGFFINKLSTVLSVWPNSSPTFYPLRSCVGCKVAILSSLKQHKLVWWYWHYNPAMYVVRYCMKRVGVFYKLMSCVPVATAQDTTRECMYWWGVSLSKHPHIYILSAVVRQRTPVWVHGF